MFALVLELAFRYLEMRAKVPVVDIVDTADTTTIRNPGSSMKAISQYTQGYKARRNESEGGAPSSSFNIKLIALWNKS